MTTTEIVATNCVIQLDDTTSQLVDISGSLNSVTIGMENTIAEFRTFGTQWKDRRVVGKDLSISLRAVYSTAAAEAASILRNWFTAGNDSPRSLTIAVPDSQAGAFRLSGEFVLASLNIPLDAAADDVVYVEAELLPDGEVQFETITT